MIRTVDQVPTIPLVLHLGDKLLHLLKLLLRLQEPVGVFLSQKVEYSLQPNRKRRLDRSLVVHFLNPLPLSSVNSSCAVEGLVVVDHLDLWDQDGVVWRDIRAERYEGRSGLDVFVFVHVVV